MNNDDDASSNNAYLSSVHEARNTVRETLFIMRATTIDPHTPFINTNHGHNHETAEAHRALNSALFDYHDHIRGARTGPISEKWNEELDTIEITGEKTIPVSLADLDEWKDLEITIEIEKTGELGTGTTEEQITRVWIPVYTAGVVYNQLDDCLHELGWAADVKIPEELHPEPI